MRRLLPFVFLILAILVIAVAIPFVLSSTKLKPKIENYLSVRLGQPVTIQQLDLDFFPPRLQLQDVAAGAAFRAKEVKVRLNWKTLLTGHLDPDSIRVKEWQVTWQRRADASWQGLNLSGLLAQSVNPTGQALLERADFDRGTLSWMDPFGSGPSGLEFRSLAGEYRPRQKTLIFSGEVSGLATAVNVKFEGTSFTEGTFTFTEGARNWTVALKHEKGGVHGSAQAAEWRWDNAWTPAQFYGRLRGTPAAPSQPILLKDWKSEFQVGGETQTFTSKGHLDDGDLETKGSLIPASAGFTFKSVVALRAVAVDALPDTYGLAQSLDGKISGLVDFEVRLSSSGHSTLEGKGTAEITEGLFHFPKASLAGVKKAKTLAYLRKKVPAFEENGFPFKKMRLVGHAQNSIVMLDEAWADGGDLRASFSGLYDAGRGGLDLYSRLDIRERDTTLRKMISGRYITGPIGKEKILPLYGHLQGTPKEWLIKAVPAAKIPAANKKQLTGR